MGVQLSLRLIFERVSNVLWLPDQIKLEEPIIIGDTMFFAEGGQRSPNYEVALSRRSRVTEKSFVNASDLGFSEPVSFTQTHGWAEM